MNDHAKTKDELIRELAALRKENAALRSVRPDEQSNQAHRGQAEKPLKDSVSLLKATLESTADGILVVDNQGRISDFNKQFARLWRIPKEVLDLHDDQKALDFVLDQLKAPEKFLAKVRELYNDPDKKSFDILEFKDGRVFERYSQPQKIDGVSVGRVWSFRNVTDRVRAEEELRLKESQLSTAFKIAHLGHWEYDVAGDRFTFNDPFYAMLHTTAEEAGGYTMSSSDYAQRFLPPDEIPIVGEEIRKTLETDDPNYSCQMEHRIIYGDGKPGYIAVRTFIIKDDRGRTVKTYGVNQDITERKLAENALRESEAKYRMLVENTSDVVWQTTPDYIFTYISPSDKKQGFFRQEEIIGRPVWEFLTPKSILHLRGLLEQRRRLIENGEKLGTLIIELEQYRKDGSTLWVEVSSTPVYDDSGRITAYQGVIRDINDRKHAEEEIHRSEEHYRQLYDAIMDVVFVHEVGLDGMPGKFLEVNEVACTRLGYTRQEFLAMSPLDIDAPESVKDLKAISMRVFAGEVVTFEQIHVAKDGRRIPVEINARLFNLGTRHAVLSLVRDITERKRAERYRTELEEERLKSQKLESVGTLAGGIAHDFNNLLHGVFGYISMARLVFDQKEKSLSMLEHAEEALHLAVNLTTQLLTFSKGGKPVRKLMTLMPVVETAVKFALSGSQCDYRIDTAADLWPVDADEGQLAQVIQNIVQNAEQAMMGRGTVSIALENAHIPKKTIVELPEGGRFVRIAIRDTGAGIPEQNLSRIFDPYFTTKQKGSGLGLATSYSIIKNHGGVIQVKSEVSTGSTFMVYLPAAERTGEVKGTAPRLAVAGKKGRILFMDDEEFMRKVATDMMQALGHEIESAADGSAAIKKYLNAKETGNPFNIVILDLTVKGGMGGTETLSRLREIDPAVVAVASSGYADNTVLANYVVHGFSSYLNKPYDIDTLRNCLDALLM
jgi:two-component system cell cycle sensor histidine kinase/response regulator CckA